MFDQPTGGDFAAPDRIHQQQLTRRQADLHAPLGHGGMPRTLADQETMLVIVKGRVFAQPADVAGIGSQVGQRQAGTGKGRNLADEQRVIGRKFRLETATDLSHGRGPAFQPLTVGLLSMHGCPRRRICSYAHIVNMLSMCAQLSSFVARYSKAYASLRQRLGSKVLNWARLAIRCARCCGLMGM